MAVAKQGVPVGNVGGQERRRREAQQRAPRPFISARLRVLAGVGVVLLVLATVSTYLVTNAFVRGLDEARTERLVRALESTARGVANVEHEHLEILNLVRGTNGAPQLVVTEDGRALQRLIEPLAANAGINSVVITDWNGVEVLGLQRVAREGAVDYAVSAETDLSPLPIVSDFLAPHADLSRRPSALARTPQGYALFTAGPVMLDDRLVGVALVGSTLAEVAEAVRASALTEVTLYLPSGDLASATFGDAAGDELALSPALAKTISLTHEPRLDTARVGSQHYQVAYAPLTLGGEALGVVGVYVPNGLFAATEASRQLLSLLFAGMTAAVMVAGFVMLTWVYTSRLAQVRAAAEALRGGDLSARTRMQPTDEVGAVGHSVDALADSMERRLELLALSLRAQRRETSRLSAVLDSVPDGLVVQDNHGRVALMNDPARRLLGSRRVFRDESFNRLTALVTDTLGAALAPGVYALGDPVRVEVNDHVLRVQAAAVMDERGRKPRRIGTVVMLHDITPQARAEQERARLIDQMAREVYEPLAALQHSALRAEMAGSGGSLHTLMDDLRANMVSLERMILEMRDLSTMDRDVLQVGAFPLPAEELVWGLLRDWQDAIDAAGLRVHVMLMDRDMFILGDERRLRWAIGNVIDNAVRYTRPGGEIGIVAATGNDSEAVFTISDSGVGISKEDMPFVGQRFFRGKPCTPAGAPVRTPGTGQGLFITQRVIEAHGGRMKIDSWPGVGTDVRLTLPLVVPEPVHGWPGAEARFDTGRYTVEELETLRLELEDTGGSAPPP
ncbi:MAG: ATP-binding protein [Anaerolineae bacterium]|nr:ATP-binding protein [Anaerolineae bacterium]